MSIRTILAHSILSVCCITNASEIPSIKAYGRIPGVMLGGNAELPLTALDRIIIPDLDEKTTEAAMNQLLAVEKTVVKSRTPGKCLIRALKCGKIGGFAYGQKSLHIFHQNGVGLSISYLPSIAKALELYPEG